MVGNSYTGCGALVSLLVQLGWAWEKTTPGESKAIYNLRFIGFYLLFLAYSFLRMDFSIQKGQQNHLFRKIETDG